LPDFAFCEKTKNPDSVWKSGFYCLLLFFKVVPPGIEPGTQGFSVLSLKTFKSLAYGSTFKGNQLSYCTLAVIL